MRAKPFPKSWLIHAIEYHRFEGRDDWNKDSFADPVTIDFVRVDLTTLFSRDSTQNKILAEGIIYVDVVNSKPLPEFSEESLISFQGKEYKLQKIIPCYHPNSAELHHYELEVI